MDQYPHQHSLLEALSEIDLKYIAENQQPPRCVRNYIYKAIAAAAALVLFISGFVLYRVFNSTDQITGPFLLTAQAENGVITGIELNQSLGLKNYEPDGVTEDIFSSGPSGGGLFGDVDMPLFNFNVYPSGWNDRREACLFFDFEIVYNNKTVTTTDDHVSIFHISAPKGKPGISGYSIMGWFREPTEITITIRNKESGNLVNKLTVAIAYMADSNNYQLKLTEMYANADNAPKD